MTSQQKDENTSTLEHLISIIPPGGTVSLLFESDQLCFELLPSILRSISDSSPVRLFTGRTDLPDFRDVRGVAVAQTGFARTSQQRRALFQKHVKEARRRDLITFDTLSGPRLTGRELVRFRNEAIKTLRRRKLKNLWLMADDSPDLSSLIVEGETIARFWSPDPSGPVWFQVLVVPTPSTVDVFAPSLVRVSEGRIHLSRIQAEPESTPPTSGHISRNLWEPLFLKAAHGMLIFDLSGSFRKINISGARILGCDEASLYTLSLRELVAPSNWFKTLRSLSTLRSRKRASLQIECRKSNNRAIVLEVEAWAIGGNLFGASFRDVAEPRKRVGQNALPDGLHTTLFEKSPVPQALFDDRKILLGNEAFTSFTRAMGWKSIPASLNQLLGKSNREIVREILLNESGDQPWDGNIELKHDSGRVYTRLTARKLMVADKAVVHCAFADTTTQSTEIRELQRNLSESDFLLKDLAGFFLVFDGTRCAFTSGATAALFGYPSVEAMLGIEWDALFGRKGATALAGIKSGKDSQDHEADLRGVRKDGVTVDLHVKISKTTFRGNPAIALSISDLSDSRKQEDRHKNEVASKAFLLDLGRGESEDLHTTLESGLAALLKGLRFEMGAVYMKDGSALIASAEKGMDENLHRTILSSGPHEGISGLIFKTAEPLVLDISAYPAHLPYRTLFEATAIRYAVCIPIGTAGAVIGIILVCTRKGKAPPPGFVTALDEAGQYIGKRVGQILKIRDLKERVQHFRGLLEALPDVVYRTNHQGSITYISPNIEQMVNYGPSDFMQSPELWRQTVHPDDRATYGQRVSSSQDRLVLEYRILPRGRAEYRWIRDYVMYSRDQDGMTTSMTGVIRDITEERGQIHAITTAGQMKANVLESIREGVAVYDSDLRCKDWNKAMEEITGLSRNAVIGLPIAKTTIRVVSLELVAMLQSALNGQTVSSDDIILSTGSAAESYYWVRCFPMKDAMGSIQGVVLTFTDVTARRALEQSVRESEETLRNVIDGMGDALMISDLQGRVWEVNKEFTRITGYSRRDVLGMSFPYPWLVDEEMARFVSWIAELRERSFLRDFDMTWHSQDGRKVAISINTSLLRNASGEPVAMLNIARDISDRKKLMTELERRNRELETLNALSTSITTSRHLSDVLRRAGEQIMEVMSADVVLTYLKDPRQNLLLLGSFSGISEEAISRVRQLHPSESATGAVFTTGEPLLMRSGLADDPRITREGREILRSLGLNSLGVIPLRSKDHILGALDVGFKEEHDFSDEEQQFLALVGAQLGSAIENAQLYEEIHRQVRRLTSLYEVGRGLAGTLDLRTILSTVYGEVRKAIPAERFTYYTYSSSRESIVPILEFDESATGFRSSNKQEIVIGEKDPFRSVLDRNNALLFPGTNGSGTMIIAPVRSGQTIAGFLVVHGSAADLKDEAHLRLLESIATLTELALDKASLYVDIVNKSKQIEARNKELDDFTYVVSHDLKEPLISIEGYSKILLKEFQAGIGAEGREYLTSLVHSSTRLKNLIDDLLTLSRLGRVKEVAQDVSLSRTVQEVLQDLQFTIREKKVVVVVGEDLPVVRYNPTQLSIVIRNLVTNALKFNKTAAPWVSIACTRDEREFTVSVADNGIGIEEEYFEKIFMIFQRLHRTEEYRGTGAGLTIVRKIVENHGGRVTVRSTPGQGSTFSFTIPMNQDQ